MFWALTMLGNDLLDKGLNSSKAFLFCSFLVYHCGFGVCINLKTLVQLSFWIGPNLI